MDVDNDPIDQNLLLQFTCLGTTDRDELIKQFKELIDRVNDATASFYLEMNNWNLQNAICSFLDFSAPRNTLSMSLVETCAVESMPPDKIFFMWWTVRNNGTTAWPADCSLRWIEGNYSCYDKVFKPLYNAIEPGCYTTLTVNVVTPPDSGWYHSTWKLMSPSGVYFGDVLNLGFHVHVKLEETEEENLSEALAARMALADGADCKAMEEETRSESSGIVLNNLPSSTEKSDWHSSQEYNGKVEDV